MGCISTTDLYPVPWEITSVNSFLCPSVGRANMVFWSFSSFSFSTLPFLGSVTFVWAILSVGRSVGLLVGWSVDRLVVSQNLLKGLVASFFPCSYRTTAALGLTRINKECMHIFVKSSFFSIVKDKGISRHIYICLRLCPSIFEG